MRLATVLMCLVMFTVGCEQQAKSVAKSKSERATILTTFYPLEYAIQRIAGDDIAVINPCPPDADPAYWQPSAEQLAQYQAADLIVINGATFEKWVANATLPEERLVDTTARLREPFVALADSVTHSHGPGEHTHAGIDGHTWVDPFTFSEQVLAIHTALVAKWPEMQATFDENVKALQADLKELAGRYEAVSGKLKSVQLTCNHPAYNYLARRYQWQLQTFYYEPDEKPADDQLKQLRDFLAHHPSEWMLWESQPTEEVAAVFQELGLNAVVVSPGEALDAEQRAAGEDFLSIMQANLDRLEQMLQ